MSGSAGWALLVVAQGLVGLLLAPLLLGVTRRVKARLQYRRGPSLWQPYRDLAKWWRRLPVESDAASPLSGLVPPAVLAVMVVSVFLVPLVGIHAPLGVLGDLLVVIGLLALVRFLLALGALDAGSAFGGMGAAREVAIAAIVEPALLLSLAVGVAAAGSTDLGVIAAHSVSAGLSWLTPAVLLGAAAFLVVAVAETGHEPVDNPDTHLELTMIHEGMILEASGRRLAMLSYAAELKLVVVVGLFASVFLPFGAAAADTPGDLAVGMLAAGAKLVLAAVLLGVLDASVAKLRILALPSLMGVAALLALSGLGAQLWLPA
ncbi:MAG: NADH-quinone oxidoreductase subunit H [Chloroflexota bacterium]